MFNLPKIFGLVFLTYTSLFKECHNFNFDTNFIDIIKIGGDENTYFGYSVLLQKGTTSSVLVGAPKSNSTYPTHANLKEPGVLYRCDIGNNEPCRPFVVDSDGNTEHKPGDSRFNYKSKRDGSLLGATLDGGETVGDPIYVCAPKWANDRIDRNGQHYLANGICYSIQNSTNVSAQGRKLMPLLNAGKQGYSLNVVKYYYALGQAGTAMHYINTGEEFELLLGAPGVLSWQGTTIRYKSSGANVSPPQQRLSDFRKKRQLYTEFNIPNPVYVTSLAEDNSYLGYAVSSGRFHSRYPDILWYVAGAPRARDLYGAVLIYEFSADDDSDLILHKKIVGHQLGSYFGAALLCTDINGDLADDILVGAPTYLTNSYDEGCVYVYKNNGEGSFDSFISLFGDKMPGARFGTAISNLGDINGDSFRDIAIAAPNEDGHGTIYIYLGSKNGLNTEYSQKISANRIDLALEGFGFSISKGVDVDQNLSNDIAVGAYISGHVAILKSKPVAKYAAKLESNMQELAVNIDTFNISYSISYNSSTGTIESLDTKIQIIKDSRAVNKDKVERMITLRKNDAASGDVMIMLSKNGAMDYTKPFTVELFYNQAEKPQKEFCANCPVTDPMESKSIILRIPFANGCGSDNICQPDLKITANFENNLQNLILGTMTTLNLYVHVENAGEPAYLPKVLMKLPIGTEIVRISSKCEFNDDRVYQCSLDNVLQTNTNKALIFELDIKDLDPKETNLFLNLTAESKGEEKSSDDNVFVMNLQLQSRSVIDIAGKSDPDQVVYMNKENKIKFNSVNVTHEFLIENLGPSPLLDYNIEFQLPIGMVLETTRLLFEIYKPEVYVNNQPMNCIADENSSFSTTETSGKDVNIDEEDSGTAMPRLKRSTDSTPRNILENLPVDRILFFNCTRSEVRCMQVICTSNEVLERNQYISAKFPIRARIEKLDQILDSKDIILYSTTANLNKNQNIMETESVHTLLMGSLPEKSVSYWIYIVCVVAAFIILAIIVFVLYKLNFFNRPVREKLQNEYENSSTVREINDDDHDEDEESDENADSRL